MFAPFSCDVDRINNERQIVLRKRYYVVALKGLTSSGNVDYDVTFVAKLYNMSS